jgi:hypothetical protein
MTQWLLEQLRSSGRGFVGAVEQLPAERLWLSPPGPKQLGEWSAVRHVFHMLYYEQNKTLPFVRQCAGQAPSEILDEDEEIAWQRQEQDVGRMLSAFQQARDEFIKMLSTFTGEEWDAPREEVPWGTITLRWMATKSYQHTCEHTNDVLQLVVFWDFIVYQEATRS